MVLDTKIFETFLQLKHQIRSSVSPISTVLEVYSVINIEGHSHLIHILNLFNLNTVTRPPVLWLALQVPDTSKQNHSMRIDRRNKLREYMVDHIKTEKKQNVVNQANPLCRSSPAPLHLYETYIESV